jgi:hypothetical protein
MYEPSEEAIKRGLRVGVKVRVQGFDSPAVIKEWTSKGNPVVYFADDESRFCPFWADAVTKEEEKMAKSKEEPKPNQESLNKLLFLGARVKTADRDCDYHAYWYIIDWDEDGDPICAKDEDDPLENEIFFPYQLILHPIRLPPSLPFGQDVALKVTPKEFLGKVMGVNSNGNIVVRDNDLQDAAWSQNQLVLCTTARNINDSIYVSNKKEEKKMAPIATTPKKAKRSTMVPVKEQKDNILSAVGKGLKLASANQAGEVILSLGEKLLGASAPAFMQDENGREVVKLLTAALIATTVRTAPEFMENSDNIAKVCELQITHSTDMLSTRLMSTSREQLQALAALGIDIARSR